MSSNGVTTANQANRLLGSLTFGATQNRKSLKNGKNALFILLGMLQYIRLPSVHKKKRSTRKTCGTTINLLLF